MGAPVHTTVGPTSRYGGCWGNIYIRHLFYLGFSLYFCLFYAMLHTTFEIDGSMDIAEVNLAIVSGFQNTAMCTPPIKLVKKKMPIPITIHNIT